MRENELNNKIHIVLKFAFGWAMRPADFAVLRPQLDLTNSDDKLVDVVATYAHEHLFGHPDVVGFQLAVRKAHALKALVAFASLAEEERNNISTEERDPGMEPPDGSILQ